MITATCVHFERSDFAETFEEINAGNYKRFLKAEAREAIDVASLVILGDVVLKNRQTGTLGKITPITATR